MNNYQIVRNVEAFREVRTEWVERLTKSDDVEAAQRVLSINSKIELLLTMWNWSDDSVEYPYCK